MSPIQQMLLGVGAVATKTYVDDVFSTDLYKSTNSNADYKVTNNLDNSGKGAMLWYKDRIGTSWYLNWDTERGSNKYIYSNSDSGQSTSELLKSFDSDGYTIKGGTTLVGTSRENVLWNFRKTPGFFDVVTYTGNGLSQNISHSLGCIPGMIMTKCTTTTNNWGVYHRGVNGGTNPQNYGIFLNSSGVQSNASNAYWNDTAPTSTQFSVGDDGAVNASGETYVAYLFAGGESDAATARSVDFDGTDDYLSLASSADFNMGTGDYTIECWFNPDGQTAEAVWTLGDFTNGQELFYRNDGSIGVYQGEGYLILSPTNTIEPGQWYHSAVVRHSGTLKLYINGTCIGSTSQSGSLPTNGNGPFYIGAEVSPGGGFGNYWPGKISNLRVVKGTAVYTSSFRPPTEPLTNITNTKLLCCNNSSVTGKTVGGTITSSGGPTASTDSPFDDSAGFAFGENEDQNVIKTGGYVGTGSAGLEINLGWEPQWILYKCIDADESWTIYDSMRGIVTGGDEKGLYTNTPIAEEDQAFMDLTPTGYKITSSDTRINGSSKNYVYMAIRRPDGYCGKPADAGTDVFAMDTGAGSSTIPNYDSNFPVDFAIEKYLSGSQSWFTSARLIAKKYVETDTSDGVTDNNAYVFDSNVGWFAGSGSHSSYQSWMWKRHAGFDVVVYKSDELVNGQVNHSLNKVPEMIWFKSFASAQGWGVYHKGLNGGSNPEQYWLRLDTDAAEGSSNPPLASAPTSTHISLLSTSSFSNYSNDRYIAMLFASVEGISKVGFYTGDGTNNGSHEITCGFTPRLLIIKCVTSGVSFNHWRVWDSLNGLDGSGNEDYLKLNTNGAKVEAYDYIDTTSTGFKFNTNFGPVNGSGNKMIYYAHA